MITLFLDFDGVLFDTAKEAYLLTRFAYRNIPPFDVINEVEFKIFYKYKYHVTNSWQYYYLIQAIENEQNIEENFIFHAVKDQKASDFDDKFQQCRRDLINNHFEYWNNLDEPYPFFYEIKDLSKQLNIVIVSTKNARAIKNKLNQYHLEIRDENIIGKEILNEYPTKGKFISKYMSDKKINFGIFIDDSVNNIETCRNIKGLEIYLAGWGYLNPKFTGLSYNNIINMIKERI